MDNEKNYVEKKVVAKKLKQRITEETVYAYTAIGTAVFQYFSFIFGGLWLAIVPLGIIGIFSYLRITKLQKAEKYIKTRDDKIEAGIKKMVAKGVPVINEKGEAVDKPFKGKFYFEDFNCENIIFHRS